ncbi:periplasmic heavy metal sensor [candidate division WOR-3 bacterium]|nr:periplasmic heavy metal sensor [candidate division WOR-3 bacterium]
MDKKVLVVVLVISVAINLATVFTLGYFWLTRPPAGQEFPSGPQPMAPEWRNTRIVRELGLSEKQIEKIKKENEEMRETMLPLRQELFMKRQELMSMLREERIDREKTDTLIEQIARLQVKHDAQVFERLARIKTILTQEQQERLGGLLHQLLMKGSPDEPQPVPMRRHGVRKLPRVEEGR